MSSLRAAAVNRPGRFADAISRARPGQSVDSILDGYGNGPELAAFVKEEEAFLYRSPRSWARWLRIEACQCNLHSSQ